MGEPRHRENPLIGKAHHPMIEEARAKHKELLRDTGKVLRESLRNTADKLWPLVAAGMDKKRLPKRTKLDTASKRVSFILTHPEFDRTRLSAAIARDANGIGPTDDELQLKIERAQAQADELSGLTGSGSADSYEGVRQDTIDFLRSLNDRRRWGLLAAFQRADFDEKAKIEGNKLISVYRNWWAEKMFYVCQKMEDLAQYLAGLSQDELNRLHSHFQAGRLPVGRKEWRDRDPEVILAAAIISASATDRTETKFRANRDLALKLIRAYDLYIASCKAIDRTYKKSSKSNHLKLQYFIARGLPSLLR